MKLLQVILHKWYCKGLNCYHCLFRVVAWEKKAVRCLTFQARIANNTQNTTRILQSLVWISSHLTENHYKSIDIMSMVVKDFSNTRAFKWRTALNLKRNDVWTSCRVLSWKQFLLLGPKPSLKSLLEQKSPRIPQALNFENDNCFFLNDHKIWTATIATLSTTAVGAAASLPSPAAPSAFYSCIGRFVFSNQGPLHSSWFWCVFGLLISASPCSTFICVTTLSIHKHSK